MDLRIRITRKNILFDGYKSVTLSKYDVFQFKKANELLIIF